MGRRTSSRTAAARSAYVWRGTNLVHTLYFKLLLLLAPIQSILLTPVQGSTPAFLLILSAAAILLRGEARYGRVLMFILGFWLIYILYMMFSLSGYLINEPDFGAVRTIRDVYVYGILRQTQVTQGLYLFVAMLFGFLVYTYFQEAFVKFAYFGIILLAMYGFYEFTFYAIFHANGDILSNRNFGDLDTAAAGAGDSAGAGSFATGSALQGSNLFGAGFMRLKSLVGEPSMYALSVTPFAVYAYARRWWFLFALLALSLVLSTSSTAVIGLIVGLAYAEIRQRQEFILYIAGALVVCVMLYMTSDPVHQALNTLLFDKLDTVSGNERMMLFTNSVELIFDGNVVRALFGVGFGTIRSTDMFSNLLANIGIIGLLCYSALLLAPCFMLRKASDRDAIVATLVSLYVMEMATVAEFAYLPPWFMIALAYVRVREQRHPTLAAPGRAMAGV
ncbi:hypothetical protein EV283_3753 [Sphingomonas sp. BK036]|nr:hypothetical protein EV283_3753 [Sphingomonas sp. BK036]